MNPKKHRPSPKIEVTTQNETLDLELPDGSKVSSMKIDGKEVHQTYCLVSRMQQFHKYWAALGIFLVLSTVAGTTMGAWLVLRMQQLPVDTAQIQRMIDNQRPPVFSVGHFVQVANGGYGQIERISRNHNGGYLYNVGGKENEGWHPQSSITFVRHSKKSKKTYELNSPIDTVTLK